LDCFYPTDSEEIHPLVPRTPFAHLSSSQSRRDLQALLINIRGIGADWTPERRALIVKKKDGQKVYVSV
jgi:hypothetical protein